MLSIILIPKNAIIFDFSANNILNRISERGKIMSISNSDKCTESISNNDELNSIIITNNQENCFFFRSCDKIICCINIIGQIEGHHILPEDTKTTKYEKLIPIIIDCEMNDAVHGLLFILNTVGGDIEAGMAISELIAGLKKPTVSIVLGGGHSIGIPLAVASKRSFIAKTGTMTIHPVRTNGLVMGVPQQFTYFNDMQERIIEFVSENSSVEKDVFRNLMMNSGQLVADFGTVLDGKESVENGLIDEVGTIIDAVEYLIKM